VTELIGTLTHAFFVATLLANLCLVCIMLDLKPDFLFCGVCEVYTDKLEELVRIALRSPFADKAFFESFFSKFFPRDTTTLVSAECVRHEAQHNPGDNPTKREPW